MSYKSEYDLVHEFGLRILGNGKVTATNKGGEPTEFTCGDYIMCYESGGGIISGPGLHVSYNIVKNVSFIAGSRATVEQAMKKEL